LLAICAKSSQLANKAVLIWELSDRLSPRREIARDRHLAEICSGIRILEFHDGIKPDVDTADAHLRVADTRPEDLVETVNQLARALRKKGEASQ
jgi:hypothetical protein